jgi:hypothetical protein
MLQLLQRSRQAVHRNCKKEIIYIKPFHGGDLGCTNVMYIDTYVRITIGKLNEIQNKSVKFLIYNLKNF